MEPKVSYTLVGAFVLLLGGALVAGLFWLSAGKSREDYTTYVAYMHESVSGLNVNAPVKYRGVTVGKVAAIGLDPNDPRRVRLLLDIANGTPVKENTVAVLASQSYITGLVYVELTGGSNASPPLRARPGERYPEIGTAPSLTTRVESVLPELLGELKTVTDRLNGVLDDKNRAALADTLANVDRLSAGLAKRSDSLGRSIDNVESLTANAARASRELPALVAQVHTTVASVNRAARSVQQVAKGGAQEMRRFTRGTLGQTNQLLGQLRSLTGDLQRLAQELQNNPNMLVFGRAVPAPGPGEKR